VRAPVLAASTALLFLATANAYAAQFSFDPSTGEPQRQINSSLPAALIMIIFIAGVFLIIRERKKAKGIWFSDSRRLK
jgi:hypothetical protein